MQIRFDTSNFIKLSWTYGYNQAIAALHFNLSHTNFDLNSNYMIFDLLIWYFEKHAQSQILTALGIECCNGCLKRRHPGKLQP